MKVLVVEGEKQVISKLEKALKSVDDSIHIIGADPTFFSSAQWMQQYGIPDLILMNRNEADPATSLQLNNDVIKATVTFYLSSDRYTFQAFRITTLGKLMPPVFRESAANHTGLQMQELAFIPGPPERNLGEKERIYKQRFLVKQGQKYAAVETMDIAYFFSEGRFIFFKTFDNYKYLVEYNLEELEELLNPMDFFRINRSLLVAFKSVAQIHPYFGNRLKLYLEPGMEKEIIVSREKVSGFKTWLGQ